jgi:AraC-like DNA-binding protein
MPLIIPDLASLHTVGVGALGAGRDQWIIEERLARAAAALTDDRQRRSPISAIGFSLGFQDAAHFSRRFRAAFGVPPHIWRQESTRPQPGLGISADPGSEVVQQPAG